MHDYESAQAHFLYEHREPCSQIAVVQIAVFFVSFVFTYLTWWAGLFGLLVAAVGYYGTLTPVVQSKVSFIQFVLLSSIVLVVVVSEWPVITSWGWVVIVLGTVSYIFQIYLTYIAIQRSFSYRAELMRSPPPAEIMVYSQQSVYTAVPQVVGGYRAPMDTKSI
ncbi:hypothetical protein DYB37_002092 [Aphanomyces astaci]|uniref:Transmembrane protein n=1 Tax=Aphanomyces astaci TaxID=112090 RepID=A0A397BTA9_APHAT|nr:hypothetical protein DYB25_003854 [Aphanomyces astaci]RHY46231.1 hypothetical protein DYB34_010682 [Aphanomyces astaci]RHY60602.1 hypothetical protein DYB38_001128 [Aphanomyces astaci]RHY72947.1 hypothetical protein DYB30_002708 [Aphanomyces astaci]RHY82500.1 hypothetical protein DYB35_001452 [Aphanomyces astaci]